MLWQISKETPDEKVVDRLAEKLVEMFDSTPDAIVFTDAYGKIATCNAGFLDMCDAGDV